MVFRASVTSNEARFSSVQIFVNTGGKIKSCKVETCHFPRLRYVTWISTADLTSSFKLTVTFLTSNSFVAQTVKSADYLGSTSPSWSIRKKDWVYFFSSWSSWALENFSLFGSWNNVTEKHVDIVTFPLSLARSYARDLTASWFPRCQGDDSRLPFPQV